MRSRQIEIPIVEIIATYNKEVKIWSFPFSGSVSSISSSTKKVAKIKPTAHPIWLNK